MSMFDTTAMGFFVPTSKFSVDDIPDLTGRVAIVTGANTGLGKLTAQHLLSHGAKVYAACRSEDKARDAISDIKRITGKDVIHFLKLDLGDLAQSLEAGKEFAQKEPHLDILVNSAGVMMPPQDSVTKDGYELQFGTNVLGHFAFTRPLLPLLSKTAKERPKDTVRIVWVSSSAHFAMNHKENIDYQSITDVKRVSNSYHYGQSKLGNIQLANEMADRLRQDGVISVSLHPGNIATDLQRYSWFLRKVFPLNPASLGVLTQLYAATSPEVTLADSGSYYVPWARKHHASHDKATDPAARKETWEFCEAQIKKVTGQ